MSYHWLVEDYVPIQVALGCHCVRDFAEDYERLAPHPVVLLHDYLFHLAVRGEQDIERVLHV